MGFIIYKMESCNYVGSTERGLNHRLLSHRKHCRYSTDTRHNLKIYKHIRENSLSIKLIPLFTYNKQCSFKIQRLVEQYYIDKHDSIENGLNTNRAFTNRKKYSRARYQKDNKRIKEYMKEYRKTHHHKYKYNKEYCKTYYLQNKNKLCRRQGVYYKKNIKKDKEYKKKYYLKNKEIIKCNICNSLINKYNIKNHYKTNKCKSFVL